MTAGKLTILVPKALTSNLQLPELGSDISELASSRHASARILVEFESQKLSIMFGLSENYVRRLGYTEVHRG